MKISDLAQPRRAKQAVKVFESHFGPNAVLDRLTQRQARVMMQRVRGMIAEHRRTPAFHASENDPAYLKLMMMEGVLRQKLSEDVMPMGAGVATTPEQKKAAQDQANKMKTAQLAQINKVKDPNVKNALSAAVQGKSMNPDQQQALANAAMASGAVAEDGNPWKTDQPADAEWEIYDRRSGKPLYRFMSDPEHRSSAAWHTAQEWCKKQGLSPEEMSGLSCRRVSDDTINELSKDTLKSYAKKASKDRGWQGVEAGASGSGSREQKAAVGKMKKRQQGVERAIDRLANESVRHSLRKALTEAELQTAQVVLAAKDLGDRVQKMLEDASAMQVKDLAALTDEIRSEVGVPQAGQYSEQVGALLGTLVQTLQATKTGLDQAMGIVTGQEMAVPGEAAPDMGAEMPAPDMGAEMPAPDMPPEAGGEMGPEEPLEEPGEEVPGSLGRERR